MWQAHIAQALNEQMNGWMDGWLYTWIRCHLNIAICVAVDYSLLCALCVCCLLRIDTIQHTFAMHRKHDIRSTLFYERNSRFVKIPVKSSKLIFSLIFCWNVIKGHFSRKCN